MITIVTKRKLGHLSICIQIAGALNVINCQKPIQIYRSNQPRRRPVVVVGKQQQICLRHPVTMNLV